MLHSAALFGAASLVKVQLRDLFWTSIYNKHYLKRSEIPKHDLYMISLLDIMPCFVIFKAILACTVLHQRVKHQTINFKPTNCNSTAQLELLANVGIEVSENLYLFLPLIFA